MLTAVVFLHADSYRRQSVQNIEYYQHLSVDTRNTKSDVVSTSIQHNHLIAVDTMPYLLRNFVCPIYTIYDLAFPFTNVSSIEARSCTRIVRVLVDVSARTRQNLIAKKLKKLPESCQFPNLHKTSCSSINFILFIYTTRQPDQNRRANSICTLSPSLQL